MVQRNQSTLTFIVPQRPSISEIEGQPQRAVDMAVTRLRPSISEIEGQPQPGTPRIDEVRGPSISEIERQPQLRSSIMVCRAWSSISSIEAVLADCDLCRPSRQNRG